MILDSQMTAKIQNQGKKEHILNMNLVRDQIQAQRRGGGLFTQGL